MIARSIPELLAALDIEAVGQQAYELVQRLYPITRSITGNGVRATIAALQETVPLTVHEVNSGEDVLDWQVPPEWNVREAWIKGPSGSVIVDFRRHNLHLLSYSVPVHERMQLSELDRHLYSIPEQPDLIPYRTSYYSERWGFCMSHRQRAALEPGEYEVCIDSTLTPGSLTYADGVLPGNSLEEFLLSTHICHPSMCNDNLSGIAVLAGLADLLGTLSPDHRKFSYRFLFVPGTIGSITWLARNPNCRSRVRHGLVAANLGDPGGFHYKQSRSEADIDRVVPLALGNAGLPVAVEPWVPFGYDERQYCSPGFDLPVGSLTRTPWGRYPQYHTSADDLSFVSPTSLGESIRAYLEVFAMLEGDRTLRNLKPYGEPQLGKRGLYSSIGGGHEGRQQELAMLWVLNLSDGNHSLIDIAEQSGITFRSILAAADALEEAGLLEPARVFM